MQRLGVHRTLHCTLQECLPAGRQVLATWKSRYSFSRLAHGFSALRRN